MKDYIAVGYLAISMLLYVYRVGKDRKPVTPGDAVAQVIEMSVLIWLILT